MEKEPILQVEGLVTEFFTESGRVKAVKGVSFDLHKGETLGIVGESGSGKSVTSLSVMGLLPKPMGHITAGKITLHADSGTINLVGLPEKYYRKYRGKEVSMIFQEPMTSLNPVHRCGHQVAEVLRLHSRIGRGEAKRRVIELFEEVKLPDPERAYRAYPHQLSGGQKQRVMIAMAMACNPAVLIADEPTTALDVTVQKTILELMKNLQEKHGMGLIFITHDLGVIAEIADRVLVMYKGEIVEQGTVRQIFESPQHPYTKGLLACRPPVDTKLTRLPTISDFLQDDEDGNMQASSVDVDELVSMLKMSNVKLRRRSEQLYRAEPLLQVRGLSTHFGGDKKLFGKEKEPVKAVDGIDFDVYPGETLGLVGESGCGKTTLGRTILKLIEPTAGQILFDGEDITKYSVDEMRSFRRDIQIIFQDPYSSLNPRTTIGSAIVEPMRVHKIGKNYKERKKFALELLDRVGLDGDHFNRYPHEFSGGQRQRICIARTLAVNPKFIICDESVSALDVSVQAQVLNLLIDLRGEFNLTYIFISHDLSVVKFISDRMMVMNKGKIEEMGLADEVYGDPQTEYTQTLINSIPKGEVKPEVLT